MGVVAQGWGAVAEVGAQGRVGVSSLLSWGCLRSPAGRMQLRGLCPSQGFGSRLCGKAQGGGCREGRTQERRRKGGG